MNLKSDRRIAGIVMWTLTKQMLIYEYQSHPLN